MRRGIIILGIDSKSIKELKNPIMEEELQNDPLDYADPVIVKVPLKTPDDALNYWNHRLETVSYNILSIYKSKVS